MPPMENGEIPVDRAPKFSEPFIEGLAQFTRGEPLTWGATPLDPYLPEIREQQQGVQEYTTRLFNEPPFEVAPSVENFVFICNQGRINHRLARNHESFFHREQMDLDMTPSNLQEIQSRVLTGHASPAEVIVIGTQLGVPTFELASVTHPYGQRIEELEPMREAVNEGILYNGGEIYADPLVEYKIKNASHLLDSSYDEGGIAKSLRMTRTKTLGELADESYIYERSSFVYVLSEEQFEQIDALEYDEMWSKNIFNLPGIKAAIESSLDENDFQTAIPISTTTYVVNKPLVRERYEHRPTYLQRQRELSSGALQQLELPPHYGETTPNTSNHPLPAGWLKKVLGNG